MLEDIRVKRVLKVRASLQVGWVLAAVHILLPLAIFAGVIAHPAARFIGIPGDSQQTMWFMGWFWHAILMDKNPFITHMMNYPNGVNLMANTSIFAEALIFGPLQLLVNSTFAYNVMVFLNLWLIGILGTLILMEFGVRRWLAILGGMMMQVLPYTSAQLVAHANLTLTAWVFGSVYVVLRMINGKVKKSWRAGAVLGLLLAGEFYTSLEILATFAMVSLIGLVLTVVLYPKAACELYRKIPVKAVITSMAALVVLVTPGLLVFKFGPYTPSSGFIPIWAGNIYVNDLTTFVIPTPAYLLSPVYFLHSPLVTATALKLTGNMTEQDGYIGIVGIVMLGWAAYRLRHRRSVRVLVALIVVTALLSMGTNVHIFGRAINLALPWNLVTKLPVINQALPSRLMFYGDILIVVVIFMAFENSVQMRSDKGRWMSPSVATLILLGTWLPIVPYPSASPPDSFHAIEPNGVFYNALKGEPTLVLSDDFYVMMQGFVNGGYAYPIASVYAFQNNSPAETAYRPLSYFHWAQTESEQVVKEFVASEIVSTRASRVLVQPIGKAPIPSQLIQALTQLCGQPLKDANYGSYVWMVPTKVNAVWFDGDVWNPLGVLKSEQTGKAYPVGQTWSIHTLGEEQEVTISGSNASNAGELAKGIEVTLSGAMNQQVVLKPGDSVTVLLGDNQTLNVKANMPSEALGSNPEQTVMLVKLTLVK